MDALLALSIVTFFETFFFRKILPLGNKKIPMQLIQRIFVEKKTPKSLDFMENIFEIVKVGQYVPPSCQNIFRF
jgi:hypothetical protein